MSMHCSICGRPDRAELDAQVLAGGSIRSIANRARVSASSLRRHAYKCLAQAIADAGPIIDGDEVLRSLRETDEQLAAWIAQCEAQDDMRSIGRLVAVRQRGLEIIARAVGLMVEHSHHVEERRASLEVHVDTTGMTPERRQAAQAAAWLRENHPDLMLPAATVDAEEGGGDGR